MSHKIIKNIGIVTFYPPMQSEFELFGIETFKKNGFNVFFIDISKILTPNLKYDPPVVNDKMVRKVCKVKELNDILNQNNLIILSAVYYTYKTLWLYRLYKKFNVPYVVFDLSYHPLRSFELPQKSLQERIKRLSFLNLIIRLVNSNTFNQLLIKKADFALIPSHFSNILDPIIGKNTKILYTHHSDYDKYLANLDKKVSPENIIVFLDEYLPYHPDFQVMKSKPPVTPMNYYTSISNFFDKLEQKTMLQVVIAAHPRSARKNLFGNRKVIYNNTLELVRKSRLVVAHSSTALNFVALYKKPVIFMTTDEIIKTDQNNTIMNMAKCFNKIPINIDDETSIDMSDICSIDLEAYNNYLNNHVKIPGTPEMNSWEMFIDCLNENHYI
jgi:hypothetical protein